VGGPRTKWKEGRYEEDSKERVDTYISSTSRRREKGENFLLNSL
jgi:hypothetical protein